MIPTARSTKQRRLILDCFEGNPHRHFTVEDLYLVAKKKSPSLGIATVYRNVKMLEESSVIQKVDLPSGPPCYQLTHDEKAHSHHHLICKKCGAILDFEDDLLEKIEQLIEKSKGFTIDDHKVAFYGTCRQCHTRRKRLDTLPNFGYHDSVEGE